MTVNKEDRNTTNATCPRHIWISLVEDAAISRGVSPEWLREVLQRQRLHRAYSAGEHVWMAADAAWMFWRGYQMAIIESADGLSMIRRAVKGGR